MRQISKAFFFFVANVLESEHARDKQFGGDYVAKIKRAAATEARAVLQKRRLVDAPPWVQLLLVQVVEG